MCVTAWSKLKSCNFIRDIAKIVFNLTHIFYTFSVTIYVSAVCFIQGQGQYTKSIKGVEEDIQTIIKRVNELTGIKESDTGLAPPALWDLAADKQTLQNEQPLQVKLMQLSLSFSL